jgi:tetratricopeptide (TPR) repeat protein
VVSHPGYGKVRNVVVTCLVLASAVALTEAESAMAAVPTPVLAAADAAWVRRDEGRAGSRASSRRISEAVSGYEAAAASPDSIEARWKLARALFFEGKFTGLDREVQRAQFERARDAGEEAVMLLQRRKGSLAADPDAAPTYFWAAVAWGEWAQVVPRVKAARAGAATKIRDYAAKVVAIDPKFEEGGGYRILGRLHDRAPRIPFVTGWVSRAEALRNLRLAVEVAPRNFVNRHFLAEALAAGDRSGREEAVRIEQEVVADAPSPSHLVEDVAVQEEAKRHLLAWTAGS